MERFFNAAIENNKVQKEWQSLNRGSQRLSILYQYSITQIILHRNKYVEITMQRTHLKQLISKGECKKCETSIKTPILDLNQNIMWNSFQNYQIHK